MANYEHKEGFGSLFNNKFKETPNQPDLRGDVMINGELMSIAGWKKTVPSGELISVKISQKIAFKKQDLINDAYTAPATKMPDLFPDEDDKLPF